MTPDRPAGIGACSACGAPLAADQRYCLACGQRRGAPRVDPLEALGFVVAPSPAGAAAPADARPGRHRPSLRLGAGLAAATLAAGIVAGIALGPGPAPGVAASPRAPIVALVEPAPAAAPAAATTAAPDSDSADAPDPTPAPTSTAASGSASDDTSSAAPTTADSETPGPSAAPTTADSDTPDTSAADDTPSPTTTTGGDDDAPTTATTTPKAVPHVWLLDLTELGAGAWTDPSPLADLAAQGTLLSAYAPLAGAAATNLALLGGAPPTTDCVADLASCVRPATEPSLLDQLRDAGRTWRAYVQDATTRCGTTTPRVGVSLFHSLADRPDCATNVVGLESLAGDLHKASRTPTLSILVPDACHDAATEPCADGAPTGPAGASDLVHALVRAITESKAFTSGGILIIASDALAPGAGPAQGGPGSAGGALVLSPRATPGQAKSTTTGPLALLASLGDLLGLDPLGQAAAAKPGALDGVLAPATASATASAASTAPQPSTTPTRRST